MSKRVLFVVTSHGEIEGKPTTGIWFTEFSEPYEEVLKAGFEVTVASPAGGPAPLDPRGYPTADEIAGVRDSLAALNATARLHSIDASDFVAVFLPGGHGPMFDLATDAGLKALLEEFWQSGKVVGSVCHGPASLLGVVLPGGKTLLHGRKVTAYTKGEDEIDPLFDHMPFSLEDKMRLEGANFVAQEPRAEHVEVDGRLVTGQNPASAVQTARKFVELIQRQ